MIIHVYSVVTWDPGNTTPVMYMLHTFKSFGQDTSLCMTQRLPAELYTVFDPGPGSHAHIIIEYFLV